MDLHPATRGFETAGERYERGRPDYPPAAIDWLVERLGLAEKPHAQVLDIGAGTGKLTRPLLERGLHVIAVEPVDGMRGMLERTAPEADVRAGQAEALPLADGEIDGVVAGQAFHWFANRTALDEFARVLKPHGHLGLIWNRRDMEQPLQAAIEEVIAPYHHDEPRHGTDAWRAAFTLSAPFKPEAEQKFAHAQTLDPGGIVDRVLSISYISALPDDRRRTIASRVRALAGDRAADLRYLTEVSVYARTTT